MVSVVNWRWKNERNEGKKKDNHIVNSIFCFPSVMLQFWYYFVWRLTIKETLCQFYDARGIKCDTTTQETLSRCRVMLSFGNLSEHYALTVSPDIVKDFKPCWGQYCIEILLYLDVNWILNDLEIVFGVHDGFILWIFCAFSHIIEAVASLFPK